MKKFLLFIISAATAFSVSAAPQKIDFDKLPNNSQEFIQKYFTREKVKTVEMDRQSTWDKYTVTFNSGNQISFEGGSGDWSKIAMKNGYVPEAVIPVKIKSFTGINYPRMPIVTIETTNDGYKVKLTDGTYLYFDKDGDYTKATK